MVDIIQKIIDNEKNFTKGRKGKSIVGVVLHTEGAKKIEGTADRSLYGWFNGNTRGTSAHYYVTFSGKIEQYVLNEDTAHQAGNWAVNQQSIGIEHQDNGYWDTGEKYTDAEYEASAQLVASLCQKYNVPIEYTKDPLAQPGVIIHREVPEASTSCPGKLDYNRILKRAREIAGIALPLDVRIRDLVAHAYEHAPTFRRIMDEAGVKPSDVQNAADLAKIPVTPKDKLVDFQQENPPFGGLLTVDPVTLPRIYLSPGPIYDPQPPSDHPEAQLAPFRAVGFGKGDRVLNTFMYHLTPAGLLIDEALRGLGATVVPTGPGNTELQIMMMTALKATGYVGTPSFLAIILDKAAEMGIPKEAITIKKAAFSAEPYTPSQRARFEGEFGMATISAYGTADLGFLAYTPPGEDSFIVMDSIYMELVDKDNGQLVEEGTPGEVVVTTFNQSYPLIRFGTGDLGVFVQEPERGRRLRLVGRVGDAIKVRGMFLHPNQLLAAMSRIPQVKHAQAVITRPDNKDYVVVRVELKPEHAGEDVSEAVSTYVQAMSRLRVDEVQMVEPGVIDPAQRAIRDERKWE